MTLVPDGTFWQYGSESRILSVVSYTDFHDEKLQTLISTLLADGYQPYVTAVGGSGLGILSPYDEIVADEDDDSPPLSPPPRPKLRPKGRVGLSRVLDLRRWPRARRPKNGLRRGVREARAENGGRWAIEGVGACLPQTSAPVHVLAAVGSLCSVVWRVRGRRRR